VPGVLHVGVTPGGFEKSLQERQGVDAETLKTLAKKYNLEVVGPPTPVALGCRQLTRDQLR
jgi:hypothetical protein